MQPTVFPLRPSGFTPKRRLMAGVRSDVEHIAMNVQINIPEESTNAVVAFAQRLLGPVAEAADFLSDKIRFLRWKTAMRTLEKAEAIAKARRIPVREVPVKFLVPFLEKCSLENEDSDLIERWAKLLVTAIDDYEHRLIAYTDILAQLGPSEVKILESMWNKTDPSEMGLIENMMEIYGNRASSTESLSPLYSWQIDDETSVDEHGRYNLGLMQSVRDLNKDMRSMQTGAYMRETPIYYMERLGLVKVIADVFREEEHHDYFVLKAQLTPLGFSFIKACSDGSYDRADSNTKCNTLMLLLSEAYARVAKRNEPSAHA